MNPLNSRMCLRCQREKPLDSEHFYRRRRGLDSTCIECRRRESNSRRSKQRAAARAAGQKRKRRPKFGETHFWTGHPHEELMLTYEDVVAACSLMAARAVSMPEGEERRKTFAHAFALAKNRDELRKRVALLLSK